MPTRSARIRRTLPHILPGVLVVVAEVAVAVFLILYLQAKEHDLCAQLQQARHASNHTLRRPFREFAREAASIREASARYDDFGDPQQRLIDLTAAARYRQIADQVRDLGPLRC